MTFPPPPGLVILAYQFGSISKTEMIRLIRMWHEKHGEANTVRMIDGDALLETVEDHVTAVSCCPTVDWSMGKTQMKKQVIEDIRNAPTIGGWISVKDRLPDLEEQVLIVYEWVGRSGEKYMDIALDSLKAMGFLGYKPLFWMPLPESQEGVNGYAPD